MPLGSAPGLLKIPRDESSLRLVKKIGEKRAPEIPSPGGKMSMRNERRGRGGSRGWNHRCWRAVSELVGSSGCIVPRGLLTSPSPSEVRCHRFSENPPPTPTNAETPNHRNEPTKQAPGSSDLAAPDSLPRSPFLPPSPSHRSGGGWAGGGTGRGRRCPGPRCPPARTVRPPRPQNCRPRSRGRKKGEASPRFQG